MHPIFNNNNKLLYLFWLQQKGSKEKTIHCTFSFEPLVFNYFTYTSFLITILVVREGLRWTIGQMLLHALYNLPLWWSPFKPAIYSHLFVLRVPLILKAVSIPVYWKLIETTFYFCFHILCWKKAKVTDSSSLLLPMPG